MSSIVINAKLKDICFETKYGFLDYDWLLRLLSNRTCVGFEEPLVLRRVHGSNLSLQRHYREADFIEAARIIRRAGCKEGYKRLCATHARYLYVIGDYSEARKMFLCAGLNLKHILYIFTSFVPPVARYVTRRFRVFG
jgi:hypothetical protein